MRILSLTLALMLFAAQCQAAFWAKMKQPTVASGGDCAGYSPCQNFEGAGYDNSETWTEYRTESQGTINEDYTGTVLRGSQSLLLNGVGYRDVTDTFTFSTATSNRYSHAIIRIDDLATSNMDILQILDSSDNAIVRVQLRTNGSLYLISGGQTDYSAGTLVVDTTYHVYLDYHAGSGSDSSADIYVVPVATLTKPDTASGSVSSGNATASAAKMSGIAAYDIDVFFDQILSKSSEFTSVPE